MSTTPYPGPDEVIIPSRIYFDDGKRIDVKVWPKTIQLTGPTKDLNKVFKTLRNYFLIPIPFILMTMLVDSLSMTLPTTSRFTKSR